MMESTEQAYQEGMRRFDAGDRAGAAQAFETALAIDPRHERAHYQLGNLCQDEGRWPDAEKRFETALALAPDHAEAHNNLGVVRQMMNRYADAEASFARAAELKPALSQPYLNLGRLLATTGRWDEAAAWYRKGKALSSEPGIFDHLLAALQGERTAAAPDSYVRETFDGFAEQFDHHLITTFDYHLPEAIGGALTEMGVLASGNADVLDLGCGTGLVGEALRGKVRRMVGVDLAPRMLEQARARACYDDLAEGEVLSWMRAAPAAGFDIVVAADVFVYIGALEEVFREATRLVRPNGLFVLSIEVCTGEDWRLQETGRYSQSAAYIERLAATNGFALARKSEQPLRKPIIGLLYILART